MIYARILDVGVRRKGFVLGQKENGGVNVVDVRDGAKIVDSFDSSVGGPLDRAAGKLMVGIGRCPCDEVEFGVFGCGDKERGALQPCVLVFWDEREYATSLM